MDYKAITHSMENVFEGNFTMKAFKEVGRINRKINEIFQDEMANNQTVVDYYLRLKNYLEERTFDKLKEKLGYEDETIRKIVSNINVADCIDDIYIIDGYVLVDHNSVLVPEDSLCDITSDTFSDVDAIETKQLLVGSLNNLFKSELDNKNILKLNRNNFIQYNLPGNILLNCTLSYLNKGDSDNAKLFVKVNDDIYYFDMKIRDGYLIISNNECKINKLSHELNKKNKVKTL